MNRNLHLLLCSTLLLSGCVRARFSVPSTVSPASPASASILPGIESAQLNASLKLPRSQYTIPNKEIRISIKNKTTIGAEVSVPPSALDGNTIILTNIGGHLTFSKPVIVKKSGLPSVAISEVLLDPAQPGVSVEVDLFQTLAAIIFNAGNPKQDGEKPLSVSQILPRLNITNAQLNLRSGHKWDLSDGMPLSLVTGNSNFVRLSSASWTDKATANACPSSPHGSLQMLCWSRQKKTMKETVGFHSKGNLAIEAQSIAMGSSDKVRFRSEKAGLHFPITLEGETDKPLVLKAGSAAHQSDAPNVTLQSAEMLQKAWRMSLESFGLSIESLEAVIFGGPSPKTTITASMAGQVGGRMEIEREHDGMAGTFKPVKADFRIRPESFDLIIAEGVRVDNVALKSEKSGSSLLAHFNRIMLGPIAVNGAESSVRVATVKGGEVLLSDLRLESKKGSFQFNTPSGALLKTEDTFRFSSDGFHIPDSSLNYQDAELVFSDGKSEATIKPMTLNATLTDMMGERQIVGEMSAAATGRVPVRDISLVDVQVGLKRFAFDYNNSRLKWSLDDGNIGLGWKPIIDNLEGHTHRYPIKPSEKAAIGFALLVRNLRFNGGDIAVDYKLNPFGDSTNPKLSARASGRGIFKVAYESLHAHIEWRLEEVKVFGKVIFKTHIPVPSVRWDHENCQFRAPFAATLSNGKLTINRKELLKDVEVSLAFGFQWEPAILTILIPEGCDVNLTAESLFLEALLLPAAIPAQLLSGALLGLAEIPISIEPFKKLGDKWNSTRVTQLSIREWSRDSIAISFAGYGEIPMK